MTATEPLSPTDAGLVRRLVGELAPAPTGPAPAGARVIEDLGYHSLALAELAIALAEAFGLEVEDTETFAGLPGGATVRDLELLVGRALPGGR